MAEEIQTSEVQNGIPRVSKTLVITAAFLLFIGGAIFFWWKCEFDNGIHFLPSRDMAEWIVFPTPPSALTRQSPELFGAFRRSFELKKVPDYASISLVAFRDASVLLNGQSVDLSKRDVRNWKQPFQVAAPQLRAGTNEIFIIVTNRLGPPAVNLLLQSGDFKLRTDDSWQASLVGSAWRPAKVASTLTFPGKGNALAGGENSLKSASIVWPWLLLAAIFSTAAAVFRQKIKAFVEKLSSRQQLLFFAGAVGLIWVALFLNNLRSLPWNAGFDSEDHIKYIEYILQNKKLPLARDGWEMFQPPLYYVLCAGALKMTGLISATTGSSSAVIVSDGGLVLLRCFGLLMTLGQSFLVLLTFRLIFRGDLRKQLFGFVFATFLPAQIYLAHYISNENLVTLLVTASICLCTYIFREKKFSTGAHIGLGALLGLALLAKVSALIPAVVILAALGGSLLAYRNFSPVIWIRTVGVTLIAALLVCSWHYIRVWKTFGTPFVGNWDESLGWHWWQYEGLRTADYYLRFGRSLVEPLFSGVNSFADGIYSTVWADGLVGGRSGISVRPPWNYDLMVVGCLLAIVPTIFIFLGAIVSLRNFFRQPSKPTFLFLALGALTFFALIIMTLRVPSYAQSKAVYGLIALTALSFFAAQGFDALARTNRAGAFFAAFVLTFFAINSVAAFWIRPGTLESRLARAKAERTPDEALKEITFIARDFPKSAEAQTALSGAFDQLNRFDESVAAAEAGLRLDPQDARCHLQMASALNGLSKFKEASEHSKRAAELTPENVIAWENYCAGLIQVGDIKKAIEAGREGLTVEPDAVELHVNLGVALARAGKLDEAIEHCSFAVKTRPHLAESHLQLGYLLSVRGRLDEAISEYQEALKIRPESAQAHNGLSDLFRRQKRWSEALTEAERALKLNPDYAEAHFQAANALAGMQKNKEAGEHYSAALKLRPEFFHAHYRLGVLLRNENKTTEAVAHWREALRLNPDWPELLNELAWILATSRDEKIRNGADAVGFAEKATELTGGKSGAVFDTLAAAYAATGRFEDAIEAELKSIQLFSQQTKPEVNVEELKERLKIYRNHQPYRS